MITGLQDYKITRLNTHQKGGDMTIKRFEEMKIWQDARSFTKFIYGLTASTQLRKDFGLKDQIQRAAVSVMSNIAEGYERDNNREFAKYLLYSKGSIGEVRSLLYVAVDLSYISDDEFQRGSATSITIAVQLANFIKYLRGRISKN
jgi:four helix bundle protein